MGVASNEIPLLAPKSFRKWYEAYKPVRKNDHLSMEKSMFCDEFTNYYDVQVGLMLLNC
jgi:hypothetical protein